MPGPTPADVSFSPVRIRSFLAALAMFFLIASHGEDSHGEGSHGEDKHGAAAKPAPATVQIPRAWDPETVATVTTPLAHAGGEPIKHLSSEEYYALPVREIWQSYPVYHPDKEPPGYLDRLKKLAPQKAFDETALDAEEAWIEAGRKVFHAPTQYDRLSSVEELHDLSWYEKHQMPVAADGTVPFFRYFIREQGKIEVGEISCASCHIRVMPDGSTIEGAQGNFPLSQMVARISLDFMPRIKDLEQAAQGSRAGNRKEFAAPWVEPDPMARLDTMSFEEISRAYGAIPPGVIPRTGSSLFYPPQVPDIIGLEERKYFDHTADVRHRNIGDLMWLSAFVQGLNQFTHFGSFPPMRTPGDKGPPFERYSDLQLYAMARYLYSLEPPANPHPFDELAARGKQIFKREECHRCHTPPLYTNNKMVAVNDFEVVSEHPLAEDILPVSIGTDPGLAMTTRRGTGLYKVPSLKGVWYRGPFEHNGSVATLEDWFDPQRLRSDYVPTGFRGIGVETRAVKGHRFGLDLSAEERRALIAFLRTL